MHISEGNGWDLLCIRVVGDLSRVKYSSITVGRKHWGDLQSHLRQGKKTPRLSLVI